MAFLYVLKPTGYIIVDSTKGYVVEFSLENECPFETVEEGKLYYGGPMKYLVEHEDGYINCKSGMIVSSDEFEKMADSFITKSEREVVTQYLNLAEDTGSDYVAASSRAYSDIIHPRCAKWIRLVLGTGRI